MNLNVKALKQALRQRELELQQLIRQMKSDHLNSSSVYKNLERELHDVKEKLTGPVEKPGR
ncbi:MAG TPA: hypothetical protein VD884_23305 [Ohtaekwangia sp.]|nr:hypothetical protein [Ohtaekwangia sp.]